MGGHVARGRQGPNSIPFGNRMNETVLDWHRLSSKGGNVAERASVKSRSVYEAIYTDCLSAVAQKLLNRSCIVKHFISVSYFVQV